MYQVTVIVTVETKEEPTEFVQKQVVTKIADALRNNTLLKAVVRVPHSDILDTAGY